MNKEEKALQLRDYIQKRPKLFKFIVNLVTSLALIISVILLPYSYFKNK
jgi:hypothetical protein